MSVLKVVEYRPYHDTIQCGVCNQNFTKQDYRLISKNTARYSGRKQYHIKCARKVNMLASDVWWNHISRYKRHEILNAMDQEPDVVEEFSQLCYAKLTEELKMKIDIHYMENNN